MRLPFLRRKPDAPKSREKLKLTRAETNALIASENTATQALWDNARREGRTPTAEELKEIRSVRLADIEVVDDRPPRDPPVRVVHIDCEPFVPEPAAFFGYQSLDFTGQSGLTMPDPKRGGLSIDKLSLANARCGFERWEIETQTADMALVCSVNGRGIKQGDEFVRARRHGQDWQAMAVGSFNASFYLPEDAAVRLGINERTTTPLPMPAERILSRRLSFLMSKARPSIKLAGEPLKCSYTGEAILVGDCFIDLLKFDQPEPIPLAINSLNELPEFAVPDAWPAPRVEELKIAFDEYAA
ncbi:MAG: hypothetical protein JXQ99_28400 [Hyphomicrobiaceae bacterium]